MKKWAINAGLVFFSLALVLGSLELGIRVFYPRFANYNLEMWRYSAELKERLPRPNLPFFHFPNRQGQFYGVDIKTNSVGFRDNEYAQAKPADTKRILVLGDSIAMGWGVRAEESIPKDLERLLNASGKRCEVINTGVGNYNTSMETDLFEWKGLAFHPDIVVLVFFINDAEPIPRLTKLAHTIRERSYLLAFLFDRYVALHPRFDKNFRWSDYYASLYAPDAPGLAENRVAIKHLVELCRQNKIQLLIANYPELHELRNYPFPQASEYIRSMAMEYQVPFVDLLPALVPYEPQKLWVSNEDTHGNGLASQIAAQAICDALTGLL